MSGGSSQLTGGAASDVEVIRDACVSKRTRVKFKSSLNGIKRWIVEELSKEDANTGSVSWYTNAVLSKLPLYVDTGVLLKICTV
ncbi:hypothetical protein L916_11511 [Phytophthora nicotianae]|uniref:Uncharacterized protein n=1 Tax=Phytophthora nicotianae TaxID=4792 RepID=W2IQX3_PHYNI|nr:hypothetical protein L916_11511 [Phytophthora nicotianae]